MKRDVLLKLTDLKKKYAHIEEFQLFNGINLDFKRGEVVSIVVSCYSIVSTLIRIIEGRECDYTGSVKFNGIDLKTLSEEELCNHAKNNIGIVCSKHELKFSKSVLNNVLCTQKISNSENCEEKAIEILTRLGLGNYLSKEISELSNEQKQKVAIAKALINNPDIILAVDLASYSDEETSQEIFNILKEIADEGKLVISFNQSSDVIDLNSKVTNFNSRVIFIKEGLVFNVGLIKKIKDFICFKKNIFNKKKSLILFKIFGDMEQNISIKKKDLLLFKFFGWMIIILLAFILLILKKIL